MTLIIGIFFVGALGCGANIHVWIASRSNIGNILGRLSMDKMLRGWEDDSF